MIVGMLRFFVALIAIGLSVQNTFTIMELEKKVERLRRRKKT